MTLYQMKAGNQMKALTIETNLSLEFLYNLTGIAYYSINQNADESLSTKRFDHFITDYVKSIYPKLPILVINDIELFLRDFSCFYIVLLDVIIHENLNHPLELIRYLQKFSTHELLNLYIERIDTPLSADENVHLDKLLDELTGLRHELGMDKQLYYEFTTYPEGIVNRMIYSLEFIYHHFFEKNERNLTQQLENIQKKHQALLNENPEEFINAILFQSKESLSNEHSSIRIFVGNYYGDKISVAYGNHDEVYFFYGVAAEKKLYSDQHQTQYEELIKSLADDTRRNLIRFLMHAPHYNKEISDHLGITTATISYHISRLVDLGIIRMKYQEGKRIYYQVDSERFNQLFEGLKRYLYLEPF